ncbi:hypothetical protein A5662_19725 [Mycobacteriaceae bacterium 1482268.1]|nr:hypothetical protein A5662_19725 [Mycobacteriaceae bacterium 1482268.1]
MEQSTHQRDPYAPVDYPTHYPPLPPPVYPQAAGYPMGYPGYSPYDPYRPAKPAGTNGKAIAALVTALAGLMFCGLPSIAGLVLGIIAMRECRRTGQDGYGLALAGTIVGGIVVALIVLYLVFIIAIAASGYQYAP